MPLMKVYDLAFRDNNGYQAAALSTVIGRCSCSRTGCSG